MPNIVTDGLAGDVYLTPYKTYIATLTQNTVSTDVGQLVIGKSYIIEELKSGDDFGNVGFIEIFAPFIATGTTPTNWANSTIVIDNAASAPVAVVMNNADSNYLGDLVWDRIAPGSFSCTLEGAFPNPDKIYISTNLGQAFNGIIGGAPSDENSCVINTGTLSPLQGNDNILFRSPIEIRVYP